ncbi:hypothetical protein SKAU_G00326520 [Synaphobranchus kaupii]|uniref:G-protein coupled receptors family 1 profile domain-containing protein n=1 Tax=Synaphobranchus kaupii TaxID=118154 RepID=A0A9Q1EPU2_SYNKA|nr:hypothetical protein SKAU_G00326520 [Synaphobranchus kaupii]
MNSTQTVSEFIIVDLSEFEDKKTLLFVLFLLAYMTILGGNTMIIYLVRTDAKLSSPMYFFLHNLSFVDIVYTSVTILNMLSGFLTETKTISVPGCFLQMYWFISMAVTGRGLLTVMAFDRYAAICNPLRYTAIMTRKREIAVFSSFMMKLTLRIQCQYRDCHISPPFSEQNTDGEDGRGEEMREATVDERERGADWGEARVTLTQTPMRLANNFFGIFAYHTVPEHKQPVKRGPYQRVFIEVPPLR